MHTVTRALARSKLLHLVLIEAQIFFFLTCGQAKKCIFLRYVLAFLGKASVIAED